MTKLTPRKSVPALEVATLDGETWRLQDSRAAHFTMIVFYRGLHCPICGNYLRDLDRMVEEFQQLGVTPIAISSDAEDRARQSKETWGLEKLTVGYGLPIELARQWGLYVSTTNGKTSTGVEEPAVFSEPGLFLVRPDGTLYAASVNTMPFARPNFGELLKSLAFIIEKGYPARGEA